MRTFYITDVMDNDYVIFDFDSGYIQIKGSEELPGGVFSHKDSEIEFYSEKYDSDEYDEADADWNFFWKTVKKDEVDSLRKKIIRTVLP
jgi:hypothetical protein